MFDVADTESYLRNAMVTSQLRHENCQLILGWTLRWFVSLFFVVVYVGCGCLVNGAIRGLRWSGE